MNYDIWKDEPKRGETDAGWCASISYNGHIQHIKTGFVSYEEALFWASNFV